jgi:hypothetical protein
MTTGRPTEGQRPVDHRFEAGYPATHHRREESKMDDGAWRELADRFDITDVINRYAVGVRTGDSQLLASLFSDDAHLDYGFAQVDGLEDIGRFFAGTLTSVESNRRDVIALDQKVVSTPVMSNVMIDLHEDTAHVESMCLAIHAGARGDAGIVIVRGTQNVDDFVRTDQGWKIRRREHIHLWTYEAPGSAGGH